MRNLVVLLLAFSAGAQPIPKAVVVLLGPPGGGKGTQAEFITRNFGIPSISTGDLLRAEVKAGTPLGQRAQSYMAKGALVPDELVNELVVNRVQQSDAARGFILDGYPRTLAQAKFLDRFLAGRKWPKPIVLHLEVPDATVIERLAKRGRADDKPDVVRERLKKYAEETRPLLEYYLRADLHRIDGAQSPEEVYQQIDGVLRPKFTAGALPPRARQNK